MLSDFPNFLVNEIRGRIPFVRCLSESEPDVRSRFTHLYLLGRYDEDHPRITSATRELLYDLTDFERNVKTR